jgi:hypothetical protein
MLDRADIGGGLTRGEGDVVRTGIALEVTNALVHECPPRAVA